MREKITRIFAGAVCSCMDSGVENYSNSIEKFEFITIFIKIIKVKSLHNKKMANIVYTYYMQADPDDKFFGDGRQLRFTGKDTL